MATISVTTEQAAEKVNRLGVSLTNIFIIQDDNETDGEIVIWYPEVGFRTLIIENNAMAAACYGYLRDNVGVRRFKSWDDLSEARWNEKWVGWNTCSDYLRHQQDVEELRSL